MTIHVATNTRNAMLNAVAAQVDAGAAGGYLEIRSGTQPANANTAPSGSTVLATLVFDPTAFAAASAGSMALDNSPVVTDAADATGTAAWARMYDSDGNAILDGSVTATGGGGDFILTSTSITVGQTVQLTSGSLSLAA